MSTQRRSLSLAKDRHRYVFSYYEGQESEILESFVRLSKDQDCDFDWFDAAVMSFQVGRRSNSSKDEIAV